MSKYSELADKVDKADDEAAWREIALEAIDGLRELEAENARLRELAYFYIDPFDLSEEDQAFFDTVRAAQEG